VKPVFFFSISRTRPSSPALGVVLFLQRFRALPPLLPPPSLPVHRKRLRLNRLVPLKLIYHPLHVGKVFWLNIHSFATWISNQNPKLNLKRMRVGGFFHFHSNRFNIHILSRAKKKSSFGPSWSGRGKNSCVKPVFFFSISRTRSSPALGVVLFLQRFRALPPPPPSAFLTCPSKKT